jgi:hypothetical protein
MLTSLIGKAVRVLDDAGVETVLTMAFVAQIAAYSLPLHTSDAVRMHVLVDEAEIVETGTVVQMPATPVGTRATRPSGGRDSKATGRTATAATPKVRVRRPDPVDDDLRTDDDDRLRSAESTVRITIIGPDGEPRTKVVRLSGSRDGIAAPARRPHD